MIGQYVRGLLRATTDGWDRFWFCPTDPSTLCVIRVLAGSMLFYTHLIWALNSNAFFGTNSWLSTETVGRMQDSDLTWSHLYLIESAVGLSLAHAAALVVFAMLTLGLCTRVVSVLAFLTTVAYANRVPGAMFGLDQINGLLAMYLMLGPSGARYSLDRLLRNRCDETRSRVVQPSVCANMAVRLMQFHLCVIYLFAGLSKLQGPTWWSGVAFWGGIANLEYQSLDVTWLVNWPLVINLLTHMCVAWEISYCVLIWNRWTRPIMLLLAIPVHLGIAFCMGMMTFGTVMLIANMAFVSPSIVRGLCSGRRKALSTQDEVFRDHIGGGTTKTRDVRGIEPHNRLPTPHYDTQATRQAVEPVARRRTKTKTRV